MDTAYLFLLIGVILSFDLQVLYDAMGEYPDHHHKITRKLGAGLIIMGALIIVFIASLMFNL